MKISKKDKAKIEKTRCEVEQRDQSFIDGKNDIAMCPFCGGTGIIVSGSHDDADACSEFVTIQACSCRARLGRNVSDRAIVGFKKTLLDLLMYKKEIILAHIFKRVDCEKCLGSGKIKCSCDECSGKGYIYK